MIDSLYDNSLFASWVLLFFWGAYFIFAPVPDKPIFYNYKLSRKIMGVAFLVFGLSFMSYQFFHLRDTNPELAKIVSLISYYLESMLIGGSLINLIDDKFINRKRVIISVILLAAFVTFNLACLFLLSGKWLSWAILVAVVWFLLQATYVVRSMLARHRKAIKRIDDFYSDNVELYVRWMTKVVYITIAFGLASSVLNFMGKRYIVIWILSGIPVFIYFFYSFMNYMLFYEQVEVAIQEPDEKAVTIDETPQASGIRNQKIGDSIQKWIARKGFTQQGITIESAAQSIGTNRTYLSTYINTQYNCSFREWITKLRVEEAKKMMIEHPEMTMSDICTGSGFLSNTHFSRIFAEQESVSPSKWKKEQMNHRD